MVFYIYINHKRASLVAQMVKESACIVGDLSSVPGLGRSPGEGKGYPFQYSGLEISMDCIMYSSLSCKELGKTERLSLSLCLLVYVLQFGYIS